MNINVLLEAGRPVMTDHNLDMGETREQIHQRINALGAGQALQELLANPTKMLFRGLRSANSLIIEQDTMASVRRAENTYNYVNLLTEILPSWIRANLLPRTKTVSCTSDMGHSSEYGRSYVVLPTNNSSCIYTGANDFWNAFEGLNHIYGTGGGGIPAVNEAIHEQADSLLINAESLKKWCERLEADLESGKVKEESLNKELKALFESDPESYNLFEILNNLLDPSHMRVAFDGTLLVPGDFGGQGEEVAVGGKIVYIEHGFFMRTFFPEGT